MSPSLSVCLFTNEPPLLVADALGDLRRIAEEIVVAVDRSVPENLLGPLVEVAGFVARVAPKRSGEGWQLDVDLCAPSASSLDEDDDERARLDRVFAGKRCMCDFCLKIRA